MMTPTYSIISNGNIIFDLRLIYLGPHIQEHNYGLEQGLGVVKIEGQTGKRLQYFLRLQLQIYKGSCMKVPQQTIYTLAFSCSEPCTDLVNRLDNELNT